MPSSIKEAVARVFVTLIGLSLLGPTARPLSGSREAVESAAQAARRPATTLDTTSQPAAAYGVYPAIVISAPDAHMRVQVEIPALNIRGEWALPCVPVGSTAVPPLQSRVWVMFEQGNTHLPVWMGSFPGN